jgi:hypothetical protein
MRFLFIARPQFPVPPERVPALIADFETWWATYREKWDAAGFFAGGGGGGGVCEVADETEFYRMMVEWPFGPYNATESFAIVDIDTALRLWRETAAPS